MNRILLFAGLLLAIFGLQAQPASLAFESAHHEKFWLDIENHEQNQKSVESINISDLQSNVRYSVRIVIDSRRRHTFTNTLTLHPGANNYIVDYNVRTGEVSLIPTTRTIYAKVSHAAIGILPPTPPQPQPNHPAPPGDNHGQPGHHGDNHGHHGQPNHPGQPNQPGHPGHAHQPGQPAPPPPPAYCSEPDFLAAKNLIASKRFESDKLTLAKQVVAGELMTVAQLTEIARLFEFETDKLEFLKFAYNYCYDKNKYYLVNSVFAFSTSIDELNRYIQGR